MKQLIIAVMLLMFSFGVGICIRRSKPGGLLVRGQHPQAVLLRVLVRKIAPAGNPDKLFSIQCNEDI